MNQLEWKHESPDENDEGKWFAWRDMTDNTSGCGIFTKHLHGFHYLVKIGETTFSSINNVEIIGPFPD